MPPRSSASTAATSAGAASTRSSTSWIARRGSLSGRAARPWLRSWILRDPLGAPGGGIPARWIAFVVGEAREKGMSGGAEMFLSYVAQAPGADKLTPERRGDLRGRFRHKLTNMDVEAL